MLRAFPVGQFRVEQAVDGVDLAGRGPAGELVDARLGDEQLAGLLVEPFVRLRARRPPPCTPTSAVNAMSYSPGSGLSSSHSIPATPSASLAASSVTPARSAPPVDSRMESIASTAFAPPGFPVNAFEGLQRLVACLSVLPIQPLPQRVRQRVTHPAVGPGRGLVAQRRQLHGRVLAARAGLAVRPRMGRQVLARRVEDLDLERAEAHDRLPARVRPVRGTAMPSLERDHAVPVGLHMPPRGRRRNASRATAAAPHGPRRTGHVPPCPCGSAVSWPAPGTGPAARRYSSPGSIRSAGARTACAAPYPALDSTAPFS